MIESEKKASQPEAQVKKESPSIGKSKMSWKYDKRFGWFGPRTHTGAMDFGVMNQFMASPAGQQFASQPQMQTILRHDEPFNRTNPTSQQADLPTQRAYLQRINSPTSQYPVFTNSLLPGVSNSINGRF